MENKFENLNQKVQVMEDTLHIVVREIASDNAKINAYLEEAKQQKEKEQEAIQEIIRIHNENREALERAQSLNESHYNAQGYIKDQTEVLKEIFQTVYNAYNKRMEYIDQRIENIPKSYKIQNHHHVEPKSKGIMLMMVVLLLTTVFALGWGINNYFSNLALEHNDVKYRMFRHELPGLNRRIDSVFYQDPERAKMVISKLEAETELRKAAEQKRREAEKVGKEAEKLQQEERPTF